MANPAFHRPDMPGLQPIAATKVTTSAPRPEPMLRVSDGEMPDRIFKYLMVACGMAVLGLLALIIYELLLRSSLTWHAFGFKFFGTSNWDPVNAQFGALPFNLGAVRSSIPGAVNRVPVGVGSAVFTTEMCPRGLRGPL